MAGGVLLHGERADEDREEELRQEEPASLDLRNLPGEEKSATKTDDDDETKGCDNEEEKGDAEDSQETEADDQPLVKYATKQTGKKKAATSQKEPKETNESSQKEPKETKETNESSQKEQTAASESSQKDHKKETKESSKEQTAASESSQKDHKKKTKETTEPGPEQKGATEEEYVYDWDEDKGLACRRPRGSRRTVPWELCNKIAPPAGEHTDEDSMIAFWPDGTSHPIAQLTCAKWKGFWKPFWKTRPKGKAKAKADPQKDITYKKELDDGRIIDVALKWNNYKGKPKQRLCCLRDSQNGQVFQIDVKHFGATKEIQEKPELEGDELKVAENEALLWFARVGKKYAEGTLDKNGCLEAKAKFMLTVAPAKAMPRAKASTKAAASTEGAETAPDTEEPSTTATSAEAAETAPSIKPAIARVPTAEVAKAPSAAPVTPAVTKRGSSPQSAGVAKRPKVLPPSDSSDDS